MPSCPLAEADSRMRIAAERRVENNMDVSIRWPGRRSAMVGAALVSAISLGATAVKAEVHIVALGDSAIRGHGVSASEAYPAQLEAALRARGHKVTVVNRGVDGDTTAGVLARLDRAVPPGSDIVVLNIGDPRGNDVVLHHLSPAAAEAGAQSIMAKLRVKGVAVYRITRMQRGLVDRSELHVENMHDKSNTMWHLNRAGYAIVVERTLPAIEALVKESESRSP
ncbi:GDSL-like Lipase/Acylhydrolase family protein [Bradyrhizobium erythrophlei]|uniref:GDSL-like Lipase/Acylhydrolase family protein n=2 Tax=Bradyrhizobium erythrophlei TaxID=1437360 RepID=A0A1M5I0T5_9BRAD|nr:GDSL-like Lipase/Acylhydrolase family protein [Bradyrhizobium erythrophlei]